jgi:hypothetical protein
MVVILACCQSVIPSTSLLKDYLGRTPRNQVVCMVALENLQRAKILVLDSNVPILPVQPVGWPGTEAKIRFLEKCTSQGKRSFEFKVS